jgi:hypothetical protein
LLGKNSLPQTGAIAGEITAQAGTETAIKAGTAAGTVAGKATFEAVQAIQNPETVGVPDIKEEDIRRQ